MRAAGRDAVSANLDALLESSHVRMPAEEEGFQTLIVEIVESAGPAPRPHRSEVDHVVRTQTARKALGETLERCCQPPGVAAREARRAENDPRVGSGVTDRVPTEADEVPDVARRQAALLARGEGQLRRIGEPAVANLVGADGVDSPAPQGHGCARREILVEVDLQRRRATLSWSAWPAS